MFTGATRNSLVVLPLALGDEYALTAAVIVTQTLVEVLGMLAYVRVVPWLVPATVHLEHDFKSRTERSCPPRHKNRCSRSASSRDAPG